jgi:hypothetical protein
MYKILKTRLSALKRVLLSRVNAHNDRQSRRTIEVMWEIWDWGNVGSMRFIAQKTLMYETCAEISNKLSVVWENFLHDVKVFICMQPLFKYWAYLC